MRSARLIECHNENCDPGMQTVSLRYAGITGGNGGQTLLMADLAMHSKKDRLRREGLPSIELGEKL